MTPRPRPRSVNKGVAGNITEETGKEDDDKVGHLYLNKAKLTNIIQRDQSGLGPWLGRLGFRLFQCLPNSTWADWNMAEADKCAR